jgi:hypothetical protein
MPLHLNTYLSVVSRSCLQGARACTRPALGHLEANDDVLFLVASWFLAPACRVRAVSMHFQDLDDESKAHSAALEKKLSRWMSRDFDRLVESSYHALEMTAPAGSMGYMVREVPQPHMCIFLCWHEHASTCCAGLLGRPEASAGPRYCRHFSKPLLPPCTPHSRPKRPKPRVQLTSGSLVACRHQRSYGKRQPLQRQTLQHPQFLMICLPAALLARGPCLRIWLPVQHAL